MAKKFDIDSAFRDRRLFAAALGDLATWEVWFAVLLAAFGLPLDAKQQEIFASVAGGRKPPAQRVNELWAVACRRSGKSRIAALIAVFLALFVRYRLAPGETGMVAVVSASVDQAAMVFGYIKGFLEASPALRKEIANIKAREIELKNGIVITVHSSSYRTVRGRTLVAAILDEVSFFRDESSATPDIETYRAIMPSLVRPGETGMLVGISTPYRRLSLLNQKHRDHFGADSADVLVVQGATTTFNPALTEQAIAAQRLTDPMGAVAEWDAEFRNDVGAFLDDALIDRAIEYGRPLEIPPLPPGKAFYRAFVDASGGVGRDSYTIAIAHKEADKFIVDVVRGTKGAFDPQTVTEEYAALLKEYRVGAIVGDHYGQEWVQGAWRRCGVTYTKSDLNKSQIYLECIPLYTRGLVRLPDHPTLIRELRLLERYTHRGGKDTVDHPKKGHDDFANSVCGALRQLSSRLGGYSLDAFQDDFVDLDAPNCDQPVDANTETFKNQLLAFCQGMTQR